MACRRECSFRTLATRPTTPSVLIPMAGPPRAWLDRIGMVRPRLESGRLWLRARTIGARCTSTRNRNCSPTFSIPNTTRLFPNHVHENPPSAGTRDHHLNHPLIPGGAGDQDPADRTVPRHRAADRYGFHFLSRRQRQCPGRIGSDSARAIHQRRSEHALHYLVRLQCRRGGDHHLLRAGHGPQHQCRERAKPGQHRAVPAPAPGGARGDPRQPGRAEHADVREHLQHGSPRRPERPFQLCQRLRHAPAQADQRHGHPQEPRQPHLRDAGLAESRAHASLQRVVRGHHEGSVGTEHDWFARTTRPGHREDVAIKRVRAHLYRPLQQARAV